MPSIEHHSLASAPVAPVPPDLEESSFVARESRPALVAALARVQDGAWLPRPPDAGSAGEEAMRALGRLQVAHSVQAWADMLGWSRQLLWDVCKADMGLPP